MRAHARLEVATTAIGGTRITRLHSEPPLLLRPTPLAVGEASIPWSLAGAARVWVAAAAAGPIGGDRLNLEIDVGPRAALFLRTVAASLVLPGVHGELSTANTRVHVREGATFVWLPEPLIAVARCRHESTTTITVEEGARLLAREELILGRHGETPGCVSQRLRVTSGNRPVYDQELRVGSVAPGWDGPAVVGGRRAAGSLVLVDPALDCEASGLATVGAVGEDMALLPLEGSAAVVSALAPDSLALRRHLDKGLGSLGDLVSLVADARQLVGLVA